MSDGSDETSRKRRSFETKNASAFENVTVFRGSECSEECAGFDRMCSRFIRPSFGFSKPRDDLFEIAPILALAPGSWHAGSGRSVDRGPVLSSFGIFRITKVVADKLPRKLRDDIETYGKTNESRRSFKNSTRSRVTNVSRCDYALRTIFQVRHPTFG